jgi:hypothetical protein
MNYHSEFSPADTEYLYQQIEELKAYLSAEAMFLLEEKPTAKGIRIILKAKDQEQLYKVDSTAPNLLLAAKAAKDTMIDLIMGKKVVSAKKSTISKSVVLYN